MRVFEPIISPEDNAVLASLKEAIAAKQIDLEAYRPRYGDYNSDIRILRGSPEAVRLMARTLKIRASLVSKDTSMGKKIIVELTEE